MFKAEIVPNCDWANREEAMARYRKDEEEGKKCHAWLDEHFPDWKNPCAYWV